MSNPGTPFNNSWLVNFNLSNEEISQKIEEIKTKTLIRPFSESNILKTISCLDLTSLSGEDTPKKIDKLIKKAVKPLANQRVQVASVCLYPTFIAQAVEELKNTTIGIATVSGGFPSGQMVLELKKTDIEKSVALGATEIDMVINRTYPLINKWEELYHEVSECKKSCGNSKLKVIMATGELKDVNTIYKTSLVCMMAGADFIKTSTGMEKTNATLEAGYIMMKAIKLYQNESGIKVGLKPAGGIRTTEIAAQWFQLLEEELGAEWANKKLFRIGASGLLDDLVAHL